MNLRESIDVSDIGFIDKEGRVGREDKLSTDIHADLLHHPGKASLHLRMKMDFRLIDDEHSSLEIITIDSENNHQQGLLSVAQTMEINAMSIHIHKREFQ
jgi:hypothetical protein